MPWPKHTFFAPSMRLDVVCLLALSVTLRYCAGKLVCVRQHNLLSGTCLDQAVMYRLCHRSWPRILAFDDVLPCRFFERPHDGLGC
jgi:hypothetical protein